MKKLVHVLKLADDNHTPTGGQTRLPKFVHTVNEQPPNSTECIKQFLLY